MSFFEEDETVIKSNYDSLLDRINNVRYEKKK